MAVVEGEEEEKEVEHRSRNERGRLLSLRSMSGWLRGWLSVWLSSWLSNLPFGLMSGWLLVRGGRARLPRVAPRALPLAGRPALQKHPPLRQTWGVAAIGVPAA